MHYEQYAILSLELICERALFITPWMQQWKCTRCGANDTCMNGQSVSEIWPRMIPYMNLPFPKENYVRLTADIFLNSCLCTYWPFITYELFCAIIEMKELYRLVVIVRELSSCWGLTMVFGLIGKIRDFSNYANHKWTILYINFYVF